MNNNVTANDRDRMRAERRHPQPQMNPMQPQRVFSRIGIGTGVRILIAFLIWLASFILMESSFDRVALFGNETFLRTLEIILIAEYAWALLTWYRNGNSFMTITGLFLLYLTVSMLGQTLVQFLPGYEASEQFSKVFDVYSTGGMRYTIKMLLYQINIVPALVLGLMLGDAYFRAWKPRAKKTEVKLVGTDKQGVNAVALTLFLILFALVFLDAYQIFQARAYMSYGEYYTGDEKSSLSDYALFGFSFLFVYTILVSKSKAINYLAYFTLAVVIFMYMLSGTRSRAIPYVGLVVVLFFNFTKKGPGKRNVWKTLFWILMLFFGILFLGYVSYSRSSEIGRRTITDYLENGMLNNFGNILYEMGISTKTINLTIKAIESGVEHQFSFIYYTLISFIPGPILSFFGIHAPEVGHLGTWVTNYGGSQSGLGYAFIAECFVNFGRFGFLLAILYGFLVNVLEKISLHKARNGFLFFPCVMLTILAKVIFSARAQFDLINGYIRLAFYCAILYFLIVKKGRIKIRRK